MLLKLPLSMCVTLMWYYMMFKHCIQLIIFSAVLFSGACLHAQSFWLHKQVTWRDNFFRTRYSIAAADTNHYFFAPAAQSSVGYNPAYSANYGMEWNVMLPELPTLPWKIVSVVFPTPDLIILASNAQYDKLYRKEGKAEYDVGHIVRSTDAGATWDDLALGARDTSITEFQAKLRVTSPIGAIEALDSNHIFAGTMTTHYLHSSNGGKTWDSIPTPVTEHWQGHYMIGNPIVNPVAAYPAPNTLIVAELDSAFPFANYVHKIYRSTDLGKSWNNGFQMTTNTTDFVFTSPMIGFAAGFLLDYDSYNSTVTIDKTTDGGETWFNIYSHRFPFTMGLQCIAFADSLYGLAAGDGGLILRTTDGGAAWEPMTTDISIGDSSLVLGGIAYPSRTKAMIASSTGEVFIYQPDTLLDMPEIISPGYGEIVREDVTIRWNSVFGATRYHVVLDTDYMKKSIVDTVVEDTYFMYHDSVTRQYDFYVTALNDTKTSNAAHRIIRSIIPASVEWRAGTNEYLYLGFAPLSGGETMRVTSYGLYSVSDKQSLDLRLYDILGREQMNLSDKLRGRQEPYVSLDIPLSSLNNGVYVAVLRTSNGGTSGKMALAR